ncbi:MAG: hypothetical protein M3Y68_01845, partial [Chloroflexota bacterium]|nr:hypothetical protein [Chloroflexota bacterium]
MDSEEEKRREEENKQFLKRLIESEAETRTDIPAEPKGDGGVDPNATTQASPAHHRTPPPTRITLDENNLPLPRRVDELDLEGTRVSPTAYESSSRSRNAQTRVARPITAPPPPPVVGAPATSGWRGGWGGCLLRGFLVALFGMVLLLILGGSVALYS